LKGFENLVEHGFFLFCARARAFLLNPVLMRYLPGLLCSEVKPNSIYSKTDYISLLVKTSILARATPLHSNDSKVDDYG